MRKVMQGLGLAVLVAVALAGTPSRAGTIFPIPTTTFDLSGTFDDGATLGGFLYIDITPPSGLPSDQFAGTVVTSFATITLSPPSSNVLSPWNITTQSQITPDIYMVEVQTDDKFTTMDLYLPVTTLIGYTGGPLISDTYMASQTIYVSAYTSVGDPNLKMGQLSLASVPEPSSLLLACLGGGVLGLGSAASWFRHRKAA
jgi:hypothetical protein